MRRVQALCLMTSYTKVCNMKVNVKSKQKNELFKVKMSLEDHRGEVKNILLSDDFNNWTTDFENNIWLFLRKQNGRYQKIKFEVPAGRYEYKLFDVDTNRYLEPDLATLRVANVWIYRHVVL